MLIIFDLDDTLIDTSGSITPYKLKMVLEKLRENGLAVKNFNTSFYQLLEINQQSESSQNCLKEFLKDTEKKDFLLKIALDVMKESLPEDFIILPISQAIETLRELKQRHLLALVTAGEFDLQRQKLKKAGIEESFFCKIAVTSSHNKKTYYQKIAQEFATPMEEVIVCGDRISIDLSPAKELGFKTVHVLQGRGKNCFGPKKDVDYTISKLEELKSLF